MKKKVKNLSFEKKETQNRQAQRVNLKKRYFII
jgi:hypothetical protein